jgi:uncharacterized repeat protein (TIGR02543 family)
VPIKLFFNAVDSEGGMRLTGSTADAVAAFDYIMEHNEQPGATKIRVINMSFGGPAYDAAFHGRIVEAKSKGILSVAAAGNGNSSAATYPSDYPEVTSVMALNRENLRASFSSYGPAKDIAAPGVGIRSTTYDSDLGTADKSGTSMAAPVVSGIAALLFAQDPELTPDEVQQILYDTATDLGTEGRDDYFGHGIVNARAALESLTQPPGGGDGGGEGGEGGGSGSGEGNGSGDNGGEGGEGSGDNGGGSGSGSGEGNGSGEGSGSGGDGGSGSGDNGNNGNNGNGSGNQGSGDTGGTGGTGGTGNNGQGGQGNDGQSSGGNGNGNGSSNNGSSSSNNTSGNGQGGQGGQGGDTPTTNGSPAANNTATGSNKVTANESKSNTKAAKTTHTITYNANGGKVVGKAVASTKRNHDASIGKLPTPKKAGYSFLGWYSGKVKGKKVTTKTKIRKDVTYYAHWKANSYTIKYNANGGKVVGKSTASVKRAYKSSLGKLPTPKKAGYKFTGWYTGKKVGKKVSTRSTVAKNITLYAHWQRIR